MTWLDAYVEEMDAKAAEAEETRAGLKALLWLTRGCAPSERLRVVEAIRKKPQRTLAEAEALDAWDRITGSLSRRLFAKPVNYEGGRHAPDKKMNWPKCL